MSPAQQREFFRLAAIWLACRHKELWVTGDKVWFFLGEMDYQAEMSMMVRNAVKELRTWR